MRNYFIALFALTSLSVRADYNGQGAGSVPPEVIQRFAPTEIEPDLRERIQNMLDVRSPGGGILHPDGKSLYFTWKITGSNQVWAVDAPKGFPRQMTGGEHPTNLADITPDGKFLVISRDRGGEENPGIYLQPVKGGALQVIQHLPKVQTFHGFVTDDSRDIFFRANQEDPSSFAIYRYSIADGKIEKVFAQKGYWIPADFDKGRLLLSKAITNTASEYWELNLKTNELKPVLGQGEKIDCRVQFTGKKDVYLVTTNKFGDFKRVYLYDLKNWKALSADEKADFEAITDHARKRYYLSRDQDGYSTVSVLDAKTLKPVTLPKFPDALQIFVGSLSRDGETVTLGIETAKDPRQSFSYNFKTRKLTQWVLPSAPEVNTSKFAVPALMQIPTRDGQAIPAFVRRPAACEKSLCPVVVHFHGGPEGQSRPGFSTYWQTLVDEGFIVVEPNVRGSDGYGKAYLDSDNGPKRLDVVTDIADTAQYVRKIFAVGGQAPKVGVMGWSYGGYSTLYAMTRFAGSYDAGVALVGMSNLETFLKNTAPYRRALRIPEYGDPDKDQEALKKLSPITYVDQVKSPLLVIQGANDPRVPAGEAIQIHEKLVKRKIPTGLILFADEGHGSQKRGNQVLELGNAIAWFKTYLK